MLKIIGLIPARGGSKGIRGKNIKKLQDKYLLQYTSDALGKSKYINDFYISSDCDKILNVANKLGINIPYKRSNEFAKDNSGMFEVIKEFYTWLNNKKISFDAILLAQPTSPLRTANHIDEAIKMYSENTPCTLVSVCQVPHQFLPESIMECENENKLCGKNTKILNRQQKKIYYARNGPAILIISKEQVSKGNIYGSNIVGYKMNKIESIDIDDVEDFDIAQAIIKYSNIV